MYADETQLYITLNTSNQRNCLKKLDACVNDVRCWMTTNYMKLNDDKSEIIFFGT